ncbi:MAG: hypothetical protein RLZZ627_813 [Pseudomonadota bacterium]
MKNSEQAGPLESPSALKRVRAWLKKPIEQKVFGLGGRISAFSYNRWVRSKKYDFGGVLHPHEMVDVSPDSLKHSTHYLASSEYSLRILLDQVSLEKGTFNLFLDVGCGKGMPPLFAKKFFSFDECIGIDFSETLIGDAKRNLEKSGESSVHFIHADASTYKIPDCPAVIFLANPFGPVMLERFLENNRDHFRKHGSLIAYGFDVHRHILPALGFEVIYRSPIFVHSLWRYRETDS